MPTLIVPLRSDNAYFGFAKETTPGTPVAPSIFPRWMDGSQIEIDMATEEVWEGDGTRHLSTMIKNRQHVKIKWTGTPRPNELGFFEQMSMGTGSDAYTAPATSTTLSAALVVGATTISLASNAGLTTGGTAALTIDPGAADEEAVVVTVPGSGTGPWVYTLTNSATIKNAHTSGQTVISSAKHVLADTTDGDYFTCEVSLGGVSGVVLRVRDCKVDSIKRSGKAGSLLMYEIELAGIASVSQGSTSTVTYDTHQPFLYTQGAWTLNGQTTGDAKVVEGFTIEQKNNLDMDVQAEQIIMEAMIFGNLSVGVGLDLIFQSSLQIANAYFNGGTTDSNLIYQGSLLLTFTDAAGFSSVTYSVPSLMVTKVGLPSPKKDGKHYKQTLDGNGTTGNGAFAYVMQTTVNNTKTAAY